MFISKQILEQTEKQLSKFIAVAKHDTVHYSEAVKSAKELKETIRNELKGR